MIKLLLGLVAVMVANFLLGTNLAQLKKEFDKEKMISGLLKIGGIVLGILAMLGCAYCTEDIIVANINGSNVNLLDGMRVMIISAITLYGLQDLKKLATIFQLKTQIEEKSEKSTISIPEENIIEVEEMEENE